MTEPDFAAELRGDPAPERRESGHYRHEHDDDDRNTQPTNGWPQCPVRDFAEQVPELHHGEATMLRQILDALIPPKDDSPENIRRWRISVGIGGAIVYVHIMLACGWFQNLGFSGFAYASDVKSITVELYEQRIFDTLVRQCNTVDNTQAKRFYAEKIQELLRKYRETTGADFRLPNCLEVM